MANIIRVKTKDFIEIRPFLSKMFYPSRVSHKGQNGKILIIGGSSLFHSAVIWAARVASYFVDIVHFASTTDNNTIMNKIKSQFLDGIVIALKDIEEYVQEDDVILIGTGMMRENKSKVKSQKSKVINFNEIILSSNEGERTYRGTEYLLHKYPEKRFVIDAGALQMMDKQWLLQMKTKAIITPHQLEFYKLFGIDIRLKKETEKVEIVRDFAKKYNCIILLKAVVDIISDGRRAIIVEGGNAGLTKGGTGDILAGLVAALSAKNDIYDSAVIASYLLKKTADDLFKVYGCNYNIDVIINEIPKTLKKIF